MKKMSVSTHELRMSFLSHCLNPFSGDPFIIDDEADDDVRPVDYWVRYRDHDNSISDEAAQLVALAKWRAEHPEQERRWKSGFMDTGRVVSDDVDGDGGWTCWVVPVKVSYPWSRMQ